MKVKCRRLGISDASFASKCQTPSLQSPATDVEDFWDDGVLVHLVLDVETHDYDGGGERLAVCWAIQCW